MPTSPENISRLREFFGYAAPLESEAPEEAEEHLNLFLREAYHDVEAPLETLRRFYQVKKALHRARLENFTRRVFWALRRWRARRLVRSGELQQPEPHRPAWPVDDTLEQLKLRMLERVIGDRESIEVLWFWPDGKRWVLVLTHDVESARGLERIHRLMEVEERYGFRSSFNLVPFKYEVPEALVQEIRGRGFEVGIHGYNHDGLLFIDEAEFARRLPAIREVAQRWNARGFRSPSTLRRIGWLERLPVEWDSSCFDTDPFEPQPGGVLSWFPYRLGPLVELPITLPQDHLVFRLLGHRDLHLWQSKARKIREAFGMVLLNVHPDPGYMTDDDLLPLYEAFLAWLKDFGDELWNPRPLDLARWWNHRLDLLRKSVQDKRFPTPWGTALRRRVRVEQAGGKHRLEVLP